MNQCVAHDAGRLGIDFANNQMRGFHRLPLHIHADQAGIPVFIRRRYLDERRINVNGARLKQLGDFGKPAGDKIDSSRADGFGRNPAGEKSPQTKFAGISFINRYGIADTDQLNQLQILEVRLFRRHKIFNQRARFRHARPQKNGHARLDLRQYFTGRNNLILPHTLFPFSVVGLKFNLRRCETERLNYREAACACQDN